MGQKTISQTEPEVDLQPARGAVCLINPPWPNDGLLAQLRNYLPPLGLLSIAARLEQAGVSVRFWDINAERIGEDELRDGLRKMQPKWVGISVLTNTCIPAHRIARLCKEECPECQVVVGGVHAESMPERMLRNSSIDAVARGDGEELMLELVCGHPFESVLGLSWRLDGKVCHNPERPIESDLDRLPFPAYHLANMALYAPAPGTFRQLPAINMVMTRGCPGTCTFCNSARTRLRSRSPQKMVAHIVDLHRKLGIRQVLFFDDTFTVLKKNVFEFCRLLEEADVDVTWTAYVRADCFSDELAAAMYAAKCRQVLIGVETGSADLMKKMGKPIKRDLYFDAVRIARSHKLEIRGSFIIGNLGETEETLRETLDFAIQLDLDLFQLNVLAPYPGTQIFRDLFRGRALTSINWNQFTLSDLGLADCVISPDDIRKFSIHAYRRFYMRPIAVARMVGRIRSFMHIRDYFTAAKYYIVGVMGRLDPAMRPWASLREEAFLDLNLEEPSTPWVTYEVRDGRLAEIKPHR
jgi:radical SAM superfamily enzyme YgiQ (UPF0313 family)